VAFAHPGRRHKKHVALFAHELTGGQAIDLSTVDGGIEVEVLQGTRLPEVGNLVAAYDETLVAHVEFGLKDQLKELGVRQAVGFGLLQTQLKAAKQPEEAQLQSAQQGKELLYAKGAMPRRRQHSIRGSLFPGLWLGFFFTTTNDIVQILLGAVGAVLAI